MEGLQLWTERDYFRAVVSGPGIPTSSWIRPGWVWEGERQGAKFPTFMKSIRRQRPPPAPAGFHRAAPETLRRWREDEFRFPPYQYASQFLVSHPTLGQRPLDASERELLLGFGAGHTKTCMSASEAKRSKAAYEDARKSLCGDSYSVLSFAVMASQMCADCMPRMAPAQIVRRFGLAPGATAHPDVEIPLTRWLAYGGSGDPGPAAAHELVKCLALTVNHTGSDVRVNTGQVLGRKAPSHGSVRSWWWQWKHLFKVRWNHESHINYLEMKMILNSLLWKGRDPLKVGLRWLHLEDSMVCLYILSKGRTSSRLLQPLCNKVDALQLGLGCSVLHGHVASDENPTDAASRS